MRYTHYDMQIIRIILDEYTLSSMKGTRTQLYKSIDYVTNAYKVLYLLSSFYASIWSIRLCWFSESAAQAVGFTFFLYKNHRQFNKTSDHICSSTKDYTNIGKMKFMVRKTVYFFLCVKIVQWTLLWKEGFCEYELIFYFCVLGCLHVRLNGNQHGWPHQKRETRFVGFG